MSVKGRRGGRGWNSFSYANKQTDGEKKGITQQPPIHHLIYKSYPSLSINHFRETLELEKSNANLVAFQWHGEASLLETDLKSSQEECAEVRKKTEEAEMAVMAKDEKIAALVLILQETLEREKEREREDEAKKALAVLESLSISSGPPRDLGMTSAPPIPSTPAPAAAASSVIPSADEPDSFWSDQKSPEGHSQGMGMDTGARTGASASLAKRVLITWDRTPGGRVKPSPPRSGGAVSFSAFLMMVRKRIELSNLASIISLCFFLLPAFQAQSLLLHHNSSLTLLIFYSPPLFSCHCSSPSIREPYGSSCSSLHICFSQTLSPAPWRRLDTQTRDSVDLNVN